MLTSLSTIIISKLATFIRRRCEYEYDDVGIMYNCIYVKYECTTNMKVVKYETFKVFDSRGNICLHLPSEEVKGMSIRFSSCSGYLLFSKLFTAIFK